METVQQKTCLGCGVTKTLTEFTTQKRGKFGKKSKCKMCTSTAYSEWKLRAVGGAVSSKICRACGETKLANAFTSRPVAKDGLQTNCRNCSSIKINTRKKLFREELNQLKKVPCFDCKIRHPPWVMQFDHLPGHKKLCMISTGLSEGIGGMKAVLAETKKCEIVCSNCHAERTHKRKYSGYSYEARTAIG